MDEDFRKVLSGMFDRALDNYASLDSNNPLQKAASQIDLIHSLFSSGEHVPQELISSTRAVLNDMKEWNVNAVYAVSRLLTLRDVYSQCFGVDVFGTSKKTGSPLVTDLIKHRSSYFRNIVFVGEQISVLGLLEKKLAQV